MKALALFFTVWLGTSFALAHKGPIRLDLEASSAAYENALTRAPLARPFSTDPELQVIIDAGKRNLDWLKYMNQFRETPLTFTIPGSLKGIPIDSPVKYSGRIMVQKYADYLAALPEGMKDVIADGKPFTPNPPIPDAQYVELGNKLDKIYQTTLRWLMAQNYLDWYRQARIEDIRGYYFLNLETDLENQLKAWSSLAGEKKAQLRGWLLGECYNTWASDSKCAGQFAAAESDASVWGFHQRYVTKSKAVWDEFFAIPRTRPELVWKRARPAVASLPFRAPVREDIRNFLAVNIEDEWKWNDWRLKLDFVASAPVHVEFVPGAVPHVNGIAGDTIVMDENTPLTEWDVQWTIRHEFGHVLGFPDCYVEFFDATEDAMISYQLDVTNLMCSRAGKLQEKHYLEMEKNYLRD